MSGPLSGTPADELLVQLPLKTLRSRRGLPNCQRVFDWLDARLWRHANRLSERSALLNRLLPLRGMRAGWIV
jgi:hypothetical protein